MTCPTCTETAPVMRERQGVAIDYCPQCRGVWLDRGELDKLITFCVDLLSSGQLKWADACPLDERTLADLMGELQDPALRVMVLRLCVELAEVDAKIAKGESIVLVAAVGHRGLHREMLRPSYRNGPTRLA